MGKEIMKGKKGMKGARTGSDRWPVPRPGDLGPLDGPKKPSGPKIKEGI